MRELRDPIDRPRPDLFALEKKPEVSWLRRFSCWLFGHAWDKGVALGWSGIVVYRCDRCQCSTHTQFNF